MKSFSLSCVVLACALLSSGHAQAQSYAEQARQRAEQAQAVAELLLVEQKIGGLQAEIDALDRKEAGALRKEEISPEIAKLEQERAEIRKALPIIEQLQPIVAKGADRTRESYLELKDYIARLERLQTQNLVKTTLAMAMETAQEIQSTVGVSGKPVEFAKWAAEKAADPVVKGIVYHGAPEYYTRKMQKLSEEAAATAPAMQRLKDLSGLSLAGWRSYMSKYEDKDLQGSTGLILGKVRVLLEQADIAFWSLVRLYNKQDRDAKSFEVDIINMRERLAEIELRLVDVKKKERDLQSPERKANQERQRLLSAQIAPLLLQRDALRQKISELETKLGQVTSTSENTSPEQKVVNHKTLRNKLMSETSSFAAQAERVKGELAPLETLLVKRKSTRERQEKEIEKVVSKANETAMYPYSGEKTDLEALDNLKRYQNEWTKAHDQHLVERGEILLEIESALANLERTFNTTPHDYLSEETLRNAVSKAGGQAQDAIEGELQRLIKEDAPPGQGRRGQMQVLKAELEQLLAQPLPESSYTRSAGFKFDQGDVSAPLHSLVSQVLARLKEEVERQRQEHQRQALALAQEKKEQEKTLADAKKEIADRRASYEAAAREFLALGPDHLKLLEEASVARDAYFSDLKSLVNSGVLEKTGGENYRITPTYIKKTLSGTPKTCQGLDRLRERLSPLADRSAEKLNTAQGTHSGSNSTGIPDAPKSEWSKINKPALHQQVDAMDNKIQAELNKIAQGPPLLGRNALISFLDAMTTGNSLQMTLPDFFNTMQQALRESDAMSKAALAEAENMLDQNGVDADNLKRLQEWYKTLLDTHEKDFGCFEPEHAFNLTILNRLKELKKVLEKLARKTQYTSAANLLSTLNALKAQVHNFAIGEGTAYRQEVERLRKALDEARKKYGNSKKSLVDNEAAQIQRLLEEIEEQLSGHETPTPGKFHPASNEQIQKLYQEFITAYGQGNHRSLMALLDDAWTGGDGADKRDAEDALVNSFKVFEQIQYRVSGFNVRALNDGTSQVSYQLKIIGHNRRQNLEHVEESAVVEIVGLVDGKPRILRTLSGNQWIR
ncbi:hypothetical protein [Azonexus sp.]|uniref:hypothetical protein n=1 Tax=Azonexus sp. TaxID=1872668 RepID=UPI0039E2B796